MNYECSLKKVRGVTRCYVLQIEDDDSDEDSDDSDDDSDDVDDDIPQCCQCEQVTWTMIII